MHAFGFLPQKIILIINPLQAKRVGEFISTSRVASSVEYVTNNMVPTQEAIPEKGGWKKKLFKSTARCVIVGLLVAEPDRTLKV